MTLKQKFEEDVKSQFKDDFKGAAFLFATRNEKYVEWLEDIINGKSNDFYTDLMATVNAHCNNGLSKPDLVSKMEYALRSCILS